jgi:hypothetical protein
MSVSKVTSTSSTPYLGLQTNQDKGCTEQVAASVLQALPEVEAPKKLELPSDLRLKLLNNFLKERDYFHTYDVLPIELALPIFFLDRLLEIEKKTTISPTGKYAALQFLSDHLQNPQNFNDKNLRTFLEVLKSSLGDPSKCISELKEFNFLQYFAGRLDHVKTIGELRACAPSSEKNANSKILFSLIKRYLQFLGPIFKACTEEVKTIANKETEDVDDHHNKWSEKAEALLKYYGKYYPKLSSSITQLFLRLSKTENLPRNECHSYLKPLQKCITLLEGKFFELQNENNQHIALLGDTNTIQQQAAAKQHELNNQQDALLDLHVEHLKETIRIFGKYDKFPAPKSPFPDLWSHVDALQLDAQRLMLSDIKEWLHRRLSSFTTDMAEAKKIAGKDPLACAREKEFDQKISEDKSNEDKVIDFEIALRSLLERSDISELYPQAKRNLEITLVLIQHDLALTEKDKLSRQEVAKRDKILKNNTGQYCFCSQKVKRNSKFFKCL